MKCRIPKMASKIKQGLVMVKPHALEQGLDAVVREVLNKGNASESLTINDHLRKVIDAIDIEPTIIYDIRTAKFGAFLLDLFYKDKAERRYYPIMIERYLEKVAFIPYLHKEGFQLSPDIDEFKAIKGTTETFDDNNIINLALGIRGILGETYLCISGKTRVSLDENAYREAALPMIDNYIHVCDTPEQIDTALNVLIG